MQKTKKLLTIGITAIVFLWTLAMMPAPASAGTFNVPIPYTTIQEAIDAADFAGGGTVQVAPGTYNQSIQMKSGVTIQGSGADVTTIQGDGSQVWVMSVGMDIYYTVLGTSDSTISGFTITGGFLWYYGIGIYNNDSSLTITNNTITSNLFGIYNDHATNSSIYHNNFINNMVQAVDESGTDNTWDDGNSGGNYWSDYPYGDIGGDGIGDMPYVIAGGSGSQDNYPFMTESGWEVTNHPPEADAGPDIVAETAHTTALVSITTGTASDPDGDPFTILWAAPSVYLTNDDTLNPSGDFPIGTTVVTLTVSDAEYLVSDTMSVIVTDIGAPSIHITNDDIIDGLVTNAGSVTVDYTVSDYYDAPEDILVSDGYGNSKLGPGSFTYTAEGSYTVTLTAIDEEGNSATSNTVSFVIDRTAPVLGYTLLPEDPDGTNGWYVSPVMVTFPASDPPLLDGSPGSGVDTVTAPVTIGEGIAQTVTGFATDQAGNTSEFTTASLSVDLNDPTVDITSPEPDEEYWNTGEPVAIEYEATDTLDEQLEVVFYLDSDQYFDDDLDLASLATSEYTLSVEAIDDSGRRGSASVTFSVVPEPLVSFGIKKLKIDWKKEGKKPKMDKIKIDGRFELPAWYSVSDLDPYVTVIVEIGDSEGTDEVLAMMKKHHWDYKRKKHEIPVGMNMDIKKLKIKWDKKGKKPDKFKLDGELDVVNDGSGLVTVILLIPVTTGGDLEGIETLTCKIHKHHWEYKVKK